MRAAPLILCALTLAGPVQARAPQTDAAAGMRLFAKHCLSPYLTAQKAAEVFGLANLRYDFYDLTPFSAAAPSPVTGRPATPGTDRRCEVSFEGDYATAAAQAARAALDAEGLRDRVALPDTHAATPGTALIGAWRLNPERIAVVQVGTRPGPDGLETYLNVERLIPSARDN